MRLFKEAGLPDGVINFIPGSLICQVLSHRDCKYILKVFQLKVFQNMWKTVGDNIHNYKFYPRIVGETGGKKDFLSSLINLSIEMVWRCND